MSKVKTKIIYCKICRKAQHVHVNSEMEETVCSSCRTKKWFMIMKKKGCNVPDHKYLGNKPLLVLKQKEDYPAEIVKGKQYIDITGYFFEDTRWKKKYLSKSQLNEIEREEIKKIIGNLNLDEEGTRKQQRIDREKVIKQMYQEGYLYKNIAKELSCSMTTVSDVIVGAIQKGEVQARIISKTKAAESKNIKRDKKIKDLYIHGYRYHEIAEKIGCPFGTVASAVARLKQKGEVEGRIGGK